ncbi:hypothetical protein D3C81_2144380 [compost metagenome]
MLLHPFEDGVNLLIGGQRGENTAVGLGVDLLHHGHKTQHRLALQPLHMLQNLRHAHAALHRIQQGKPAQYPHI